jgi:Protein of unknown function (DUF1207)
MAQQQRTEFLPKGHLFEPITLDPIEAQTYWSIGRAYMPSAFSKGLYAPFAIGFQKPMVRWQNSHKVRKELSIDLANFTQFEIYYDQNANKNRRNMVNADFKVSVNYQVAINKQHSYRIRLFHISSHLGDDHIIRNHIDSYTPNPVNYEHLDFTYSIQQKMVRYYAGVGYGVRPYFDSDAERKRLALQGGFWWKKSHFSKKNVRWVAGADIRCLQQNDFVPGVKVACGIQVGEEDITPLNFLLEYYNGHLPYSVYEPQRTQWIVLSMYFNPF